MPKLNLGPWVLVSLICVAAGCGPTPDADLSPDGKLVAFTNADGLILHETSGKHPDMVVHLKDTNTPKFSPDSRWIAMEQRDNTVILETSGPKKIVIKGVSGPYAWRPDGTELVGAHQRKALVIHLASKQIVRSYALSAPPSCALWMGDDRDMAFASGNLLTVFRHGIANSHQVSGSVVAMSLDSVRHRLVWAEAFSRSEQEIQDVDFSIEASDFAFSKCETILRRIKADQLMASKGRVVEPTSISISPAGDRIAVVGFVDASEPGLMQRYSDLGGFNRRKLSKAQLERVNSVEKQLKFDAVCAVTPLTNRWTVMAKRVPLKDADWPLQAKWTSDGNTVALVTGESAYLMPVNQ